jgi:DNA polymerase III subunit gamma/tau
VANGRMSAPITNSSQGVSAKASGYVVIARRYRPRFFNDLIGQEHVSQALMNAITTDRVGHAYLFTGARGVGKTSAARILAKALNCAAGGPTPTPCDECDVCQSINSGDDVDVLEIDGASNRGIDEIRSLRQNVNVRPSRTRFKIYIIDEVHMLTREAFNALLKTLEEPPEHVKFIFCTTEPTKIPVTILSRCQRFDFAGIQWDSIAECLRKIVEAEGVSAEPEALQVIARRAAGSMRDAQSLLEQLLAFAGEKITVADVHGMLGTAGDQRLTQLVGCLVERDASGAMAQLDAAAEDSIDVGQLLEQLFGYFRDCMAAAAGCPAESFLYASVGEERAVADVADRLGLQTVLAVMQILDQTLSKLRYSTQGRILAELALVRICSLEDLEELTELIAQLQDNQTGNLASPSGRSAGRRLGRSAAPASGGSPAAPVAARRVGIPVSDESRPAAPAREEAGGEQSLSGSDDPPKASKPVGVTAENAMDTWNRVLAEISGMVADHARQFDSAAISAPNHLVISFKPSYTFAKSVCEKPDHVARFEQVLAAITGQKVRVEFSLAEQDLPHEEPNRAAKFVSQHQRIMEVSKHPMIQRAGELFGASPTGADPPPDK